MNHYTLSFTPDAQAFFDEAQPPLKRKLLRCFEHLQLSPEHGGNVKRLSGRLAGLWRYRVGDYRVVYQIRKSKVDVLIVEVGHRRDIYE